MMSATWSMIWHQAMTRSFLDGKAFGWNKTVAFALETPVAGEALRLRLSNQRGSEPAQIGALGVAVNGVVHPITVDGQSSFSIPVGETRLSDPCAVAFQRGEMLELREYYTNAIMDSNMIEEGATLVRGNMVTNAGPLPHQKPFLAKALGAYVAIPAIEGVEVLTDKPAKAIVAFGDSITALSQWTKPLGRRLYETYPCQYVLLNSGISGNCLLYEPGGLFGPVFGMRGTRRFERDVLAVPNLHTVVFGLGVNDVSYLTNDTASLVNLPAFQAAVTDIVLRLHARGVRMVMQTITPRLGVARTMGKYTRPMEELRLQINDWIRSSEDLFDYLFDAEAVVRDRRQDGWYFREGIHQGDHLHPNAEGGRLLADAFDLERLTGASLL